MIIHKIKKNLKKSNIVHKNMYVFLLNQNNLKIISYLVNANIST